MILTKGLGFLPTWKYQPETLSYRENILGYAINERSLQHVDKFVRDCKEAGVWSKLLEVATFTGDSLVGALVKVKYATSPTMTGVNFVLGDYTEATGLLGNGTTKYLDLGFNATGIPAAAHLAVYLRENESGGARYFIGSNSASGGENALLGTTNGTDLYGGLGGGSGVATATAPNAGFYYLERGSATSLILYQNNMALGTPYTANTVPNYQSQNVYAFARNVNGAAASFVSKRMSFLSIGASMTASERTNFYNFVQTLQTNLGRNV